MDILDLTDVLPDPAVGVVVASVVGWTLRLQEDTERRQRIICRLYAYTRTWGRGRGSEVACSSFNQTQA